MIPFPGPLQAFWKPEDPLQDLLVLGFFGILVLVAVVSAILRKKRTGNRGHPATVRGHPFSRSGFRKAALDAGLPDADARFLEEFARASRAADPDSMFRNPGRMDAFFRDALRHVDKTVETDTTAEERRSGLLRIRESLEIRRSLGPQIGSTRQLRPRTTLSFISSDETNYPSVVLAAASGGIAVEAPPDSLGRPTRFRRGTRLTVYFYGTGHQGYSFRTRVRGYEELQGRLALILKHSDSITPLPSRKHHRRDLREACTFQRMRVEVRKERGKTWKNVSIDAMPFPGTAVDISAGGISIQTANPLEAQEYLKVDFDVGEGNFSAYGTVVRTNRMRSGGVMHVRFVKLSRKAINSVLSYVYGYTD
ncbi:MAG TPA: flagellar brake protein [Magnetospirillaceae bacterium]|nr:flagellar brake protein [Magnetospirillaceae bacterium]